MKLASCVSDWFPAYKNMPAYFGVRLLAPWTALSCLPLSAITRNDTIVPGFRVFSLRAILKTSAREDVV